MIINSIPRKYVFFSIRASVVLLRNLYQIVTLIWTPMKQVIHISPFIFLAYWKIRKAVKTSIVFWILKFIVLLPSLNGILYSKMIHWTGNQFSPFVLKPLRIPLCNGSNTVWLIELYQLGHTLKRYKLSLLIHVLYVKRQLKLLYIYFSNVRKQHIYGMNFTRARNSRLQTRKMRAEIQFCELKIWALEKKLRVQYFRALIPYPMLVSKSSGKQNQAPRNTDLLFILCDFILFCSAQVSSANPLRCKLPVVYKQLHVSLVIYAFLSLPICRQHINRYAWLCESISEIIHVAKLIASNTQQFASSN